MEDKLAPLEETPLMEDKLTYLGHASLKITTRESKTIYIDPYAGDDNDYKTPADLILVTHDHFDHNEILKVKNRTAETIIITWKEALKDGVYQSFDLGFIKIQAVPAGYNKFHNEKECVGFILTLTSGIKIYVPGDTAITPAMDDLKDQNIDYCFLPMDGIYTMTPETAMGAAEKIKAKQFIPYHTDPNSPEINHQIVDRFTAKNKLILEQGEELILKK